MNTQVEINLHEQQGIIEPNIFSHNLEHTRSCIYKGLSAQLLRNRKFAGKPAAHSGEAVEWYKIGGRETYLTLDRFDSYVRHEKNWGIGILKRRNELNSQVVQNPYRGKEAGIGQNHITLQKGKKYIASVVVKTNSDEIFSYSIRIVDKRIKCTYVEKSITPKQHQWEKASFSFCVAEDTEDACFEIVTVNRGEIKIGVASLIPADNILGLRPDVIEKLKEIGPSVLRWPGGNFASEYHWKDGLMDIDMRGAQKSVREIETHPYTHGFDFHELAIDEFIGLCRILGAEPYLTINFGRDSAEECAQFVEYCNGDKSTVWGKVRAERGYEEPYAVKYWSLGNEQGLGHMEGPNTPEAYTQKAIEYARKMRKVDPDIILFASGAYSPEHDYSGWLSELPKLADEGIKYISYHNYTPRIFEGGADFVTNKGLKSTYEQIMSAPDNCLDSLKNLRFAMNNANCKEVGISYDEWNLYFAWYHHPGVMEGLYTALMLEMLCKNHSALNVPMVMYFQPVNEGAIVVENTFSELSANGQVMSAMKAHKGNTLVKSSVTHPKLRCLASRNVVSNETIITLINTSYDEEIKIELSGVCGCITKKTLYRGESLNIGTCFAEYEDDLTEEQIVIPAHSFMHIIVKLTN